MRGSSPKTRREGGKTEKRSVKWAVLSLKFAAWLEVARAMWTFCPEREWPEFGETRAWERSDRSWTVPGRGAEDGKTAACRARCSA